MRLDQQTLAVRQIPRPMLRPTSNVRVAQSLAVIHQNCSRATALDRDPLHKRPVDGLLGERQFPSPSVVTHAPAPM